MHISAATQGRAQALIHICSVWDGRKKAGLESPMISKSLLSFTSAPMVHLEVEVHTRVLFFKKKKTQQQWCARQTINISGHTSQEKILNWNTWSRVFRLHSRSRIPKHSLISTAREITLIIKNYKHFRVMSHQKLSWKALWPKRYNQSTWWKRSKIEPNKPRLPYIGAPVTRGPRVTDR